MVHFRRAHGPKFDPEFEVEQLCQIGAAELLMPEEEFLSDLERVEFSLHSLRQLSTRYSASREATLRRMIGLGNVPAAVVFFSRRLKPEEKSKAKNLNLFADVDVRPVPKMRVLYSVASPDFDVFIPQHKSVPDDSAVNAAEGMGDEVHFGTESWGLAGFADRYIEAIGLPTAVDAKEDAPAVAALVFAERPNRRPR